MLRLLGTLTAAIALALSARPCSAQGRSAGIEAVMGSRVRVRSTLDDATLDGRLASVRNDSLFLACDGCTTRTLALQDTRTVELYEGRHPTVVGVLLRTVIGAGIGAGAGYVTGRESSRNCHGDLCGIGGAVAPALLAIGGGAVGFVDSLARPPARWRQIWP